MNQEIQTLKQKVIELRKYGLTFKEIGEKLNINKRRARSFASHIKLSKEQIANKLRNIKFALSAKKYENLIVDKNELNQVISKKGFFGALKLLKITEGCARYWCKKYNIELTDVLLKRKRYDNCQLCNKKYPEININKPKFCGTCTSAIRRITNKLKAIEYKGAKCIKCGYSVNNYNYAAFEFHHHNKDKEMSIGQNLNRSWRYIKSEIDKCVLLCSNCHRIEHSTYKNSTFIKELRENNFSLKDIFKSELVQNQLKDNGSKIKEMIKTNSVLQVAQNLNLSQNTIRVFCKNNNINFKTRKKFEVAKEELENLVANKPMTEIGKIFSVSDAAIRKRCLKLSIDYKKLSPTANCKKQHQVTVPNI